MQPVRLCARKQIRGWNRRGEEVGNEQQLLGEVPRRLDRHGDAVPIEGAFQRWIDACTATSAGCTFTILKDSKLQATFNK